MENIVMGVMHWMLDDYVTYDFTKVYYSS